MSLSIESCLSPSLYNYYTPKSSDLSREHLTVCPDLNGKYDAFDIRLRVIADKSGPG